MAYQGLVASLPVGMQGFSGSRNPSQMGPGHLIQTEGLSLEGGIIQKEGGAQKLNDVALGGAVIAGINWSPVAAAHRDVVFTADGKLMRDDGSGAFSTTLAIGLIPVRVPPPVFAVGGGETVGSSRKLFFFSALNQVKVLSADALTMSDISDPPLDWLTGFPTFGLQHAGRMWGGGNSNDPHRIYASTIADHENFLGTGDVFATNVSLLLHFDGSDSSTKFDDDSLNSHVVTAVGDAHIDIAQKKFGVAAGLFDGTGDYLTIPDNQVFEFGGGAFTIEGWVRFSAVATAGFVAKGIAGSTFSWQLTYSAGNLVFSSSTAGVVASTTISNAWTPNANIWYHFAVTRSGTSLRMFIDGVQIGTTQTNSDTFFDGAGLVYVAASQNAANPLNGRLDEVRITKGVARYTTTFVPATSSFADASEPISGALNFPIYPAEGDGIVGAISFRGVLVIFKYPVGIYILDTRDPSPTNWSVSKLSGAIGTINHSCIIQIENDVICMDEGGNIHLLSATNDLGDINTSNISQLADMRPYLQAEASLSDIRRTVGIWYAGRRQAWFSLPTIANINNDLRLIVDFNKPDVGPRFIPSRRDVAICMWLRPGVSSLSKPVVGDDDGFVWLLEDDARNKDGVAYPLIFETSNNDLSFLDPALASKAKNASFLEIVAEPRGNWDLTVNVFWDDILTDVVQFSMGQSGATLGTFVLDVDALTSSVVSSNRQRIAGSGRRFRLLGRNDGVDQNVAISSFYLSFTVADERTGQ